MSESAERGQPVRLSLWDRGKRWAKSIKRDVVALWIAGKDPRTPWQAKALAALVAGYALSPIDLIPDFIPVLGYLDDVILLPVGILLAVRMIPDALMDEFRREAAFRIERPTSHKGMAAIIGLWLVMFCGAAWWWLG